MILAPPGDGRLGPVHVLRFRWHDRVHLDAKPRLILWILLLGGEHMILLYVGLLRVVPSCLGRLPVLVSLHFSRQAWWWAWQLMVALLQVSGEAALPSSVSRWLTKYQVTRALVTCIKHSKGAITIMHKYLQTNHR
jgi:hypothetical protein